MHYFQPSFDRPGLYYFDPIPWAFCRLSETVRILGNQRPGDAIHTLATQFAELSGRHQPVLRVFVATRSESGLWHRAHVAHLELNASGQLMIAGEAVPTGPDYLGRLIREAEVFVPAAFLEPLFSNVRGRDRYRVVGQLEDAMFLD